MTTKYTFKQEYSGFKVHDIGHPPTTVSMEIEGDLSLPQILERFEDFLRGAGFRFDGYLDFVQDDEPNNEFTMEFPDGTQETITINGEQHSDFYYDTDRNK